VIDEPRRARDPAKTLAASSVKGNRICNLRGIEPLYCSPMHEDTIADWQRLTQLYGEMGDGELEELNACIGDLTDSWAQSGSPRRDDKKRGLNEPSVTMEHSSLQNALRLSKRVSTSIR